MQDSLPVPDVLLAERSIEPKCVTCGSNVGWRSAFTEHLLDRIPGNQVDQEKDQRHHKPDYRQGVEDALEERFQ